MSDHDGDDKKDFPWYHLKKVGDYSTSSIQKDVFKNLLNDKVSTSYYRDYDKMLKHLKGNDAEIGNSIINEQYVESVYDNIKSISQAAEIKREIDVIKRDLDSSMKVLKTYKDDLSSNKLKVDQLQLDIKAQSNKNVETIGIIASLMALIMIDVSVIKAAPSFFGSSH